MKGCCWIMRIHQDSWPPEEKNSIWGQRRGLIAQSFCVIKFYWSIKEIENASDIGIRRGQKEYPLASVNNEVIYSPNSSLTPLNCILKNWGRFDPQGLKGTHLVFLCDAAWPRYPLEDGKPWPVGGSLNYNTVLQLYWLYHEKRWTGRNTSWNQD